MSGIERAVFEARAQVAEGDGRTVSGIAVPYGQVTYDAPRPERFMPGAFTRSLEHRAGRPVKVLRNHDMAAPAGLGQVRETDDGLLIEARMAATAIGDEAAREVAAGVLDAFSVSFRAIRERMVGGVREVLEAALHEVSLVALPAYQGARVLSVRSASPLQVPPRPEVDLSPLMIGGRLY